MILARSMRLAALASAMAMAGAWSIPVATAAPVSDFARFFAGRTEGTGRLKVIMRRGVDVRVEGTGHIEPDGTLVLAQIVHEGDKPARTRTWRIREASPGRFTGTLSDARGPVSAERGDGRLHVAFTGEDGNAYEQWLTFAGDGRSAHNTLQVRKMGIVVANLEETIRKLDR